MSELVGEGIGGQSRKLKVEKCYRRIYKEVLMRVMK